MAQATTQQLLAERLSAADPPQVARLLARVEALDLAMRGLGPARVSDATTRARAPLPATADAVAGWLLTPPGRAATIAAATSDEQVVLAGVVDRHRPTRGQLCDAAHVTDPERVDRAIDGLLDLTLLEPHDPDADPAAQGTRLVLRGDLLARAGPVGRTTAAWLRDCRVADLRAMCEAWSATLPEMAPRPDDRKVDLQARLEPLLVDPEQIVDALDGVVHHPFELVGELSPWLPAPAVRDRPSRLLRPRLRGLQTDEATHDAIDALVSRGVLLSTPYVDSEPGPYHHGTTLGFHDAVPMVVEVHVSAELATAAAPRLVLDDHGDASTSSRPPTVAVDTTSDAATRADRDLLRLVERWDVNPATALANGGIGKRPIRAAAGELDLEPGHVGVLAHLAIDLGLLGLVTTSRSGRGARAKQHRVWRASRRHQAWRELPAHRRWDALARRALTIDLGDGEEAVERVGDVPSTDEEPSALDRALLHELRCCPPGEGFELDTVVEHLSRDVAWVGAFAEHARLRAANDVLVDRTGEPHPLLADRYLRLEDLGREDFEAVVGVEGLAEALDPEHLPRAVHDLVLSRASLYDQLGIAVVGDGHGALTDLGRALLAGDDATVEQAFTTAGDHLVVQSDLTVTAPPTLSATAAARLSRIATLESDAGASVHRLDERRIAQAAGSGETADELLAWLEQLSVAPLPDTVRAVFDDVTRRAEQLAVHGAGSVLVADDPLALTRGLAVRTAKLRQVAPTVAVSELGPDRLRAALLDAGVVVGEAVGAGDGAPLTGAERTDSTERPEPTWQRRGWGTVEPERPRLLPIPTGDEQRRATAEAIVGERSPGVHVSDGMVVHDGSRDRTAQVHRELVARRRGGRHVDDVPW